MYPWYSFPTFAHILKTSDTDLKKLDESYSWQLKLNKGLITNKQFREQLLNCSNEGNIYCSSRLGDSYYRIDEYSKAYPLLIKSQGAHAGYHGAIYADSDEMLGYIFAHGQGVLQNYDKAIKHFKVCASIGDKNCANYVARIYNDKLTAIGIKNVDTHKEEFFIYEYLKQEYAWNKIAQSLGMNTFVKTSGKVVSVYSILQKSRERLLVNRKPKKPINLPRKYVQPFPNAFNNTQVLRLN